MRKAIVGSVLLVLAIGLAPLAASANVACPSLYQAAAALRLATPDQVAQYHAGLAEGCRARLAAEANVVVHANGRFVLANGQVWIPAMNDAGGGGSSDGTGQNNMGGGNSAENLNADLQAVGGALQTAGAIAAGIGAAVGNAGVMAAGAIATGVGAALNAIGGNGNGNGGTGSSSGGTGYDGGTR